MGGVELRAQIVSHALIRRSFTYSTPSSIRFTLSTLTVGSPNTPRKRPLVHAAMMSCTKGRFLGVFGEPTVNVLKVNLMLDGVL